MIRDKVDQHKSGKDRLTFCFSGAFARKFHVLLRQLYRIINNLDPFFFTWEAVAVASGLTTFRSRWTKNLSHAEKPFFLTILILLVGVLIFLRPAAAQTIRLNQRPSRTNRASNLAKMNPVGLCPA